jgi:putative NADH-flavin reductase
MKLVLIGATGYTGSRIREEALNRGHRVTAVARDISGLAPHPQLVARALDVTATEALRDLLVGQDAVISAYNPGKDETGEGTRSILTAVASHSPLRLIVVGGAGSLEIAPGVRLVDQPDFPEQWKTGALRTAALLDALRARTDLNWTFISPAALLQPGVRTGHYRLGQDQLLTNEKGESRISVEDYAVALLDEVERATHSKQRISVAY